MKAIVYIGWFILGIIQFFAMVNGFISTLGGFFGIIAAFIMGEVPILGTIMGIIGATKNWDWSILQALVLFIGAPIILIIINVLASRKEL